MLRYAKSGASGNLMCGCSRGHPDSANLAKGRHGLITPCSQLSPCEQVTMLETVPGGADATSRIPVYDSWGKGSPQDSRRRVRVLSAPIEAADNRRVT